MELQLEWRDRRLDGAAGRTVRRFLDFVVDGHSLYDRIEEDLVSCLGWLESEEDERAAQRLLGVEPPDIDDRVAVYICPEDGDVYCGAVTAVVGRRGNVVEWRALARTEMDWTKGRWHHEPLTGMPQLGFDATQYEQVIAGRGRPAS
jgi:hypothetical protein